MSKRGVTIYICTQNTQASGPILQFLAPAQNAFIEMGSATQFEVFIGNTFSKVSVYIYMTLYRVKVLGARDFWERVENTFTKMGSATQFVVFMGKKISKGRCIMTCK